MGCSLQACGTGGARSRGELLLRDLSGVLGSRHSVAGPGLHYGDGEHLWGAPTVSTNGQRPCGHPAESLATG